jgi:hypothetical protein
VCEETGRPHYPHFPARAIFERAEASARAALGTDAYARAAPAGRALARERAIAEAITLVDELACMDAEQRLGRCESDARGE